MEPWKVVPIKHCSSGVALMGKDLFPAVFFHFAGRNITCPTELFNKCLAFFRMIAMFDWTEGAANGRIVFSLQGHLDEVT